ncbi:peptidase M24 [Candidatus Bathyarchaeota archaeon RBG_13_52_12]|nr:MAG: peptidase M24 [Candidatus Bathyarchaeota archaeon RBG_13_52_12]
MPRLSISVNEYRNRVERLREELKKRELDAFLITNGVSIFYMSGFYHMVTERPAALLIPGDGDLSFMGPLLEADHLKHQTQLVKHIHTYLDYPGTTHPIDLFAKWLSDLGYAKSKIGTDNTSGASATMGYTGPPLTEKLPEAKLVKADDILWEMRLTKSPEELDLIRESAKWGNLAHQLLQEYTSPGRWDADVALEATMEATAIMKKTLGPQYTPTAGTRCCSAGFRGQVGSKSAMPHSIAIERPIKQGDVLVTGAGADVGGYNSELERTMIVGPPTDRQKQYFEVMMEAQDAAISALKPGASCADVDIAANKIIHKAGHKELVRHHTGHGIGLQGHEPPWLDQGNPVLLKPGMVVSIEPGIYRLGYAGFRHSDTLIVTADGNELVTYYPRDLESLTI